MKKLLAVVGTGNTLASDDGVGVEVVKRVRERFGADGRVLFAVLEGDLFAIADLLPEAERFLFVDAIAGDASLADNGGRLGPSPHQADIDAVMGTLKRLEMEHPFPHWEVWGVPVSMARQRQEGFSSEVEAAASVLAGKLEEHLSTMLSA